MTEGDLAAHVWESLPVAVVAADAEGRIRWANPGAARLLGRRADELVGTLVPDERPSAGGRRLLVVRDHGDEVAARRRLDHLGTHDALTNLANRALLRRHLERRPDDVERVVVLIDLDHFGRVNDERGHDTGDEVLVAVAERLLAVTGPDDLVARTGGDEFGVVLAADPDGERVETLRRAARRPLVMHGRELAITASLGAVRGGGDVLREAGLALQSAKRAGRDALVWFDPALLGEDDDRLALATALRHELDLAEDGEAAGAVVAPDGEGPLSVVYQPLVDLHSGRVVGVEALVRWCSAELGVVAPERFIAVAEEGDLIDRLGERVLRTACAAVADLQRHLGRPLRLAVNVSPRQLRRRGWLVEVARALADAGLDPAQLEVEITESLLVEDDERTVAVLQTLRALGARVVVDDFGRGYSSLAYLSRLPVDRLKIDRRFVQQIGVNGRGEVLVEAIIAMAHALGLEVVAEGVETEEQERYLRARGCEEAQGYRYGPGVGAATLATNLVPT